MYRLVAILLLVAAVPAVAQIDRRDRDEPEIFLNVDGRSGTCDVMMFTDDGRTLYAGGDDKVVRYWPLGRAGLETGRMRTLRWPAWREQRGGIKTMALSPTGDGRVFVGGWGLKSGAVVLFDKDGEIISTTDRGNDVVLPEYPAMASSFTPDGKGVIYGTSDGRLYHWDLTAKNTELGRHSVGNGKTFNRPRIIRFFKQDGADVFLSVAESGHVFYGTADGKGGWTLTAVGSVLDAFQKAFQGQPLPRPLDHYSVYRADLSVDGAWLACSVQPNYLVLVSLKGGPAKVERVDYVVRSLAWEKTGRLAVGVTSHSNQNLFQVEGNDTIRIYDDPTRGDAPTATAEIKHTGRAEYLAWNPNGILAVAGGDNHEVRLHNVPKGVKPAADPMQVVRGLGRGIWQVRLGKDENTFEFRVARKPGADNPNEVGTGDWLAYNFATGKPTAAKPADQVAVRTTADGWTVEPTKSPLVWEVVHQTGARKPLPMDKDRDEQPRCYCFIPAKGPQATRLLVGHYYGFSIFELDPAKAPVRTVLATGHAGDVTSIATDEDGTWAITASVDMTLAGWSLADWPNGALGAKFDIDVGGDLKVGDVDLGGPAWEMGLTKGDQIVMVSKNQAWPPQFGLPGTYLKSRPKEYQKTLSALAGTAVAGKAALDKPTPGIEHFIAFRRPGQADHVENASTARKRPLWRFLPAFDDQGQFAHWVAWIWKTGHYATSTNGDFLIGWQVNDPTTISGKKPEMIDANQLRKQLERRLTVRQLMQTRDLPKALKELFGANPQPIKFGDREPTPVRLKVAGPAVTANGLPVEVAVDAQGRNPDLLPQRVEVWVNDHRVSRWDKLKPQNFGEKLTIPASEFRAGDNQVTVLTFNQAGGRSEAKGMVKFDRPEERPRLVGLMVGINDYSQSGNPGAGAREFGDLKAAVKDAEQVGASWKGHAGKDKFYAEDRLMLKLGKDATRKEILDALEKIAQEARPDDRVIIFLAGHGDFVPDPNAPKGTDEKFFVFCCPDYKRAQYDTTGITGAEIFEKLAKCKGRQLILLDACHSGELATENVIRALLPEGHGPTVLAACDQREQSFEHPKVGNGLFTSAVLKALGPDYKDEFGGNRLDPRGLFTYVKTQLPLLLKETGKPMDLQNPQAFPVNLARFQIAGPKPKE
jgi:WD40 repeat protein